MKLFHSLVGHCETPRVWSDRDKTERLSLSVAYHSALIAANFFHFSGKSSAGKIADTGHAGRHAPQSIQSSGSM